MSTSIPPARPLRGRFLDLDPDKLRGGYYTSSDLCAWVTEWAVRSEGDRVLEPSCGDGAFIRASADRLLALGANPEAVEKQLVGVEIITSEAIKSRSVLTEILGVREPSSIMECDFFEWWRSPGRGQFDAVVGNPPFIRYQTFPEPHRSRAMKIMTELGLKPNKLTNIWVPFVTAAAATLVPGGRLGLVIPAELLQVGYAAQLRHYLVAHFSDVHVVTCNELLFEAAEQEVVLLLASGAHQLEVGDDCGVSVSQMATREELLATTADMVIRATPPKVVQHEDEKWLKYFLSQTEIDLLRDLRVSGAAGTLDQFASVDVGVVTGKNEFFVVSASDVARWCLQDFVLPLAARAAHLAGSTFSRLGWENLVKSDERVFLLQIGGLALVDLPPLVRAYVEHGESLDFHLGYKCSIREPWYKVPSVWAPDAFMFRQIHDFPRLVVNDAGATCTDTIHRVRVLDGDAAGFAAMCYTSLSAASAEIEGRSYGGGVLELEPREAERLLVPATRVVGLPVSEIDLLVRAGRLSQVIDENDKLILGDHMGLSAPDRRLLRNAWMTMRNRRSGRRKARKPQGRI